ncbi:peptidoglycan editing factor PgeF [Clostridium sp. AL.422]|uniref:peptidoglycan editing factor PgeF n=1 Tax=Clostridium TaxID=1485 RepID=UPI00293DAE50|nr:MULTISPECIES: peptidoglycan editing factor PgeF [unclassified Clostridium]MDV4151242.1 peptidoglycan editing factor PgeF [Clostridium sp. AL.422]
MISLYEKDFNNKKDFLIYKLGKINIAFSTAVEDRSFNRHKDFGIENLNSIVKDFNLDNIEYLNQIHSDKIHVYDDISGSIKNEEGDAIITKEKNTAIGVFTADCVPIIIADIKNNIIASIHSGWRGTFNSIVLKTLEKMVDEFKIDLNETKVFIGPHIRQCCYEVSEELKESFVEKTKIQEDLLFKGRNLSLEECILKDLREFGVKENNIYSLKLCTYCENNIKLYSYRKSVGTYGRLFSFAFIK